MSCNSCSNAASVAPRALYEEVAERLRQQILRHELEPCSWIATVGDSQAGLVSRNHFAVGRTAKACSTRS